MIPKLGIALIVIGCMCGIWWLIVWLAVKRVNKLINIRIHIEYSNTDFTSIGMSSPFVRFYFNIHSCLSYQLKLTGKKRGNLWNPNVEPWRSNWEVDTQYQDKILPDEDSEIRILWEVPPHYNSGPMAEFAFRAIDTGIQPLSFDDMELELECTFLKLKSSIGWLTLTLGIVDIEVSEHNVFERVRNAYYKSRSAEF